MFVKRHAYRCPRVFFKPRNNRSSLGSQRTWRFPYFLCLCEAVCSPPPVFSPRNIPYQLWNYVFYSSYILVATLFWKLLSMELFLWSFTKFLPFSVLRYKLKIKYKILKIKKCIKIEKYLIPYSIKILLYFFMENYF